jgi:uroporphyrinogen decarboxylase
MKKDHLLLRTIRGEAVERPPVWAMRQAGRWDPEFNKIRSGRTFYEFSENAELSAQASLLSRRFGVDAIILFYDITTLAVAMGLPFQLLPDQGPVPLRPIRSRLDVDVLTNMPLSDGFRPVMDMLAMVRKELADALPVLVFAGAPFTLGSYCIGTGKDINATRRFAREQPEIWSKLLDKICTATVYFLSVLAYEGAAAYQLFDSWAGELTAAEYDVWAQPMHSAIFSELQQIPSILFVKECTYLERMIETKANVVSLGVSHDLANCRRRFPNQCFQGNVSQDLMRDGSPDKVYEATRHCVEAGGGRYHIVNLSHGMDRASPVANFEAFISAVKEDSPAPFPV